MKRNWQLLQAMYALYLCIIFPAFATEMCEMQFDDFFFLYF